MTVHAIDRKLLAAGDEQMNPDALTYSFSEFWADYPRKVARKDAEKAWNTIDPKHHQKIRAGLAAHKQCHDWKKDSGQFIPYPATYLRGERWEDELGTAPTMGQCCWNRNGNRGPEGRCTKPATTEKQNIPYCSDHSGRA